MELSIRKICFVGVLTAVICVLSVLIIPTPWGVPYTLQVFGIALCGFVLGPKDGILVVAVYCALGIMGLPVFSGLQSGPGVLFGPSGGYLVGFFPFVLLCGFSSHVKQKVNKVAVIGIALLLCHAIGVVWLNQVTKMGYVAAALSGSLPYLLKDVFLVWVAYYVSRRIRKIFPVCKND